jgi:CRISPR/Cas system-associated exonuclease Cas4 (RecB family)
MPIPESISYSAFGTYTKCPHRYKKIYIDKRREPTNKYAFYGTVVHSIIDQLYADKIFIFDYAYTLVPDALAKEAKKTKNTFITKGELTEAKNKTIEALKTFFDLAKREGLLKPCIQHEYEITANYRTSKLRAKLDLIAEVKKGGVGILDWKTGSPDEDNILQLALYAVLYEKREKQVVSWLVPFYLKTKEVEYYEFDDRLKGKASKYFEDTYNALISDVKFEPIKTSYCFLCSFSKNGECPLFKGTQITL